MCSMEKEFKKKKHYCVCGCGQEIVWKPTYLRNGLPQYIRGHHLKNRTHEEMYGVEGAKKKREQ